MIASPCTKVCEMDAERLYCAGCARTLNEIARWGEMTDAERSRVLSELSARRSADPISTEQAIPDADSSIL
ncbi:MAG: DUF1289 domain-containing protein [Pseudomonadota bacterium]